MSESERPDELSETVSCPRCNGTGEIDRPTCSWKGCDQKMLPSIDGNGWECPIHSTVVL